MNLFKRLFKPAWQSADPERRASAVQNLRDAELREALPSMATQDSDPKVRRAVMLRMDDLGLYADRSRHDTDAGLRADARKRFISGIVEAQNERAGEAERLLLVEDDQAVLEAIARGARTASLRRTALERLQRQGLLADCVLSDPDAEIRMWLLERISAESALKRIIDQSRKTDKRIYRAALAKLEHSAISSGDDAALKQHARDLCARLETLLHALPGDAEQQLSAIQNDWHASRERTDATLVPRVEGLLGALSKALQAIHAPVDPQNDADDLEQTTSVKLDGADPQQENPDDNVGTIADAVAEPETVLDPRLLELRARLAAATNNESSDYLELQTSVSAACAEFEISQADKDDLHQQLRQIAQSQRNRQRAASDAQLAAQVDALIVKLQTATQAQQAGEARAALSELESLRESNKGLPKASRAAFTDAKAEARKLLDWQRWSNNEIRKRLCEDIEALPAVGMHPDAVAARIKELQNEWRRIDGLEGIDPKAPAQGMARRFNALVFQVMKPARPYFEKRAELRRERGAALDEATSSIEQRIAEARDRKALLELRRSLVDSLRELNEIDPRQRKSMGARLRADLNAVDAKLAEQTEQVELSKRRVIAELRRDLAALPAEQHADRAKQAQQRWRSLGIGDRKRDQAQWKELRELVDPVFSAADDQRQNEQAENKAQREAVEQVLQALDQACADEQISADGLNRVQSQVREQLLELGALDRGLEKRVDESMRRVEQRTEQRTVAERLSAYTALATRAARLDRIEQGWLEGDGLDRQLLHDLVDAEPLQLAALQSALHSRGQRLLALAGESDEVDAEQVLTLLEAQQRAAEHLLLDCEFFAGVDSPESCKAERMNLQVKRLAERMAGSDASDATVHAARLWAAWFGVGPLSATTRKSLSERFAGCRAALETAIA